jgi:pimeloyl-ACP methyl ester carboxylesterase
MSDREMSSATLLDELAALEPQARHELATTRAVIDPGGQTVSAHDYLPDAAPIPTLIIWGSRDRMIPAWHAIRAQRSIPGCRVELFEGAGHFPAPR